MAIGIGSLRQRVNVLAPVMTKEQYGQDKASYVTLHENVAASIEPVLEDMLSEKRFAAKQVYPEVTHRVVMRYTPTIKTDMVIDYRGRKFNIKVVIDEMERREKLLLLCEERVDGVRV